ncbi:MAG TPA: hypothetical protein VFV52_06820 [Bacilli bacterium]|nr:hypothetical protein [Bacilli bacterium]
MMKQKRPWSALLQASWRVARPFLTHTLLALVICLAVVGLDVWLGQLSFQVFHQFWFSVFWLGFSPIWLTCYGLFCTAKWRWYEFSLGVFAALCGVALYALRSVEETSYLVSGLLLIASCGTAAALTGFAMNRLTRSLRQDTLEKKRLRQATPPQTPDPKHTPPLKG